MIDSAFIYSFFISFILLRLAFYLFDIYLLYSFSLNKYEMEKTKQKWLWRWAISPEFFFFFFFFFFVSELFFLLHSSITGQRSIPNRPDQRRTYRLLIYVYVYLYCMYSFEIDLIRSKLESVRKLYLVLNKK